MTDLIFWSFLCLAAAIAVEDFWDQYFERTEKNDERTGNHSS